MVEYTRVDGEMKYWAEWLAGDGAEGERVGENGRNKMNANETKWNEVSISRLTTNVLQQKVIIFRCEPSERTLSVRLNFQIFPSLVAPLSSSLSYIIIFFYKLTFNSTPFHLLTPSSCIGSRLFSSSRYYYFSLFLFLSFPTHSSRFLAASLCLTDSPTLSFALSVIRYIYIYI